MPNTDAVSRRPGFTAAPALIKVAEVIPYLRQMYTRMPFRFGKTVMTGMPVLHLRVRMEDTSGRSFEGWSACGLVSMWFDKDYSKSESKRESDLLYSVAEAIKGYASAGTGTPWDLHKVVEPAVRQKLAGAGLNGLVSSYGIALVDAAIIDGVCRAADLPFYQGLKNGILGFDPEIASYLPTQPSPAIALRHTVGLGDPLTDADVSEWLNDGLPQTLEQVCDQYGAHYFKIKVNNDVVQSLERLKNIASVLEAKCQEYQVTLDGNEAFPEMESFRDFVSTCANSPEIKTLWDKVLWIEQPVARQHALADSVAGILAEIRKYKPVIVDESDDSDMVFDRAIALGYAGISAKNCKGIYRTLGSFLSIKRSAQSGLVLSSEDLTNQPILPNHQDLCVAGALRITHSERNGHHFFRGFKFLPVEERDQALADYPSLYEMTRDGIPSLRFQNGKMCLGDINSAPGLGVKSSPVWNSMTPVELPEMPQ